MPGNLCREKASTPRTALRGDLAQNGTNMHHATSTWISRPESGNTAHLQPNACPACYGC